MRWIVRMAMVFCRQGEGFWGRDEAKGQEFEIERIERGEYRLTRKKGRPNEGLVDWPLSCPEKGWFQPLDRTETTDSIKPLTFE